MKKIIRTLIIGAVISCCFNTLHAQSMVGANLGMETVGGDFSSYYKPGLGANVFYKFLRDNDFAYGFNVGYYTHSPTSSASQYDFSKLNNLQLIGSVEYYFLDGNIRPFAGIDAGYDILSYTYSYTSTAYGSTTPSTTSLGGTESRVSVGAKAGAIYKLNDNFCLTGEAGYNVLLATDGVNSDGSNNIDVTAAKLSTIHIKLGIAFMFE